MYTSSCRLLLSSTNMSRILKPIISRCLCIRVPSPTINEITSILLQINDDENLNFTKRFIDQLGKASDRNLRKGLLIFESCLMRESWNDKIQIPSQHWERFV